MPTGRVTCALLSPTTYPSARPFCASHPRLCSDQPAVSALLLGHTHLAPTSGLLSPPHIPTGLRPSLLPSSLLKQPLRRRW